MEFNAPLSKITKYRLTILRWSFGPSYADHLDPILGYSEGTLGLLIIWGVFVLSMSLFVIIVPLTNWSIFAKVLIELGVFAFFGFTLDWIINRHRRLKRKILANNEEDYALSLKVKEAVESVQKHPLDLFRTDYPGVKEFTGFKPVRLDYFPESSLKGEFSGRLWGSWGLFTFSGNLEGNITGDVSPELNNQNVVITAINSEGATLRFICPSILIAKQNFEAYFKKAAKEFTNGSHTCQLLWDFWTNDLKPLLDQPNPQLIYSQVVGALEKPLEQRPDMLIAGIEVKEGTVLVGSVGLEGRGSQVVAPLSLVGEARALLSAQLPKPLPEPDSIK